ncbi:MAG: hypothetical protein SOI44_09930 [Lactimicrobium sp.]|uniref:hypothetical protein n=1 Tax=Lactimicrobium sp. TaxID=2563780 RepID=UPI002F3557C9
MSFKTKTKATGMITVLMGIGCFMMAGKEIWIPCIIVLFVWLGHIYYFFFRV